jgi:hypothetical protein
LGLSVWAGPQARREPLEGGVQPALAVNPALIGTLDRIAEAAVRLESPWWIFGSTAAVLLGLDDLQPADVDVLAAPADAAVLLRRLGGEIRVSNHDRFRSEVFGTVSATPLPVEVVAGFRIRTGDDAWTPVEPETRLLLPWRDLALAVPDAREQARLCRLLGRPKDLARAERLDRLEVDPARG